MEELDRQIYALLSNPMRGDEVCKRMPGASRRAVAQALQRLLDDGKIVRNKKNKYGQAGHFGCLAGSFQATGRSFAFVTPEEGGADIFIAPGASGGAWQGDRVLIRVSDAPGRAGRREGEVLKVLSRSRRDVTGVLEKQGRAFVLRPDSDKFPPIVVARGQIDSAQTGDKVAVRVTFYGDPKRQLRPQGAVTAVLGTQGTMEASVAAVLHENGIYEAFPADVLQQAENTPTCVELGEAASRLDLRDELIFTIDGDDAKDFDDAVSLELLENGRMRLGVHIADVSHYVTMASPLDAEAYRRGTSVYYPGHVVPMLPFALSNGICSLNPDVERLAFSALIEVDKDGRRHGVKFAKSVIRSKARMTYKKVNAILAGDPALRQQYAPLAETLGRMDALAKALRSRRLERGALDLDIPEPEILVDGGGHACGVEARPRGDAEKLIEEFMLLANESVAEYMEKRGYPTVYRVHENPDPDKLGAFAALARQFGYRVDASKPEDTRQLQAVIDGAKGKPDQRVLPTLLLRSLARARYSDECIGHYGLKAKYYLHFTSPIRRYPDLVAHRMLYKAVSGQEFAKADAMFCGEAAAQATSREMAADTAERDIDKLYLADYMSQFIGQAFDATVSGVTSFGLFVALPNTAEGLVRIEALEGDAYEFDPDHLLLIGVRTGKRYGIGSPMRVQLVAASNVTGQIDFTPV
ncbi:ribonuclease R [Intestinibacillus massiliensis]|nr:ribonuclease R [Intestinibacillus massiliensis]